MEAQAIEGYGCKCGFKTDDLNTFRAHLTRASLQDGKGTHTSIGRVNMTTGAVTMPPYTQRTRAQKNQSVYSTKKQKGTEPRGESIRQTSALGEATQIKFVPRVFTCDHSPIMVTAHHAAQQLWGWPNMALIDFLDTVIYKYFKRCGVTLTGFIIDETEEERIEREKTVEQIVAARLQEQPVAAAESVPQ